MLALFATRFERGWLVPPKEAERELLREFACEGVANPVYEFESIYLLSEFYFS